MIIFQYSDQPVISNRRYAKIAIMPGRFLFSYRFFSKLLGIVLALYFFLYLYTVTNRILYPSFSSNWDYKIFAQSLRTGSGENLYPDPSREPLGLLYPPLYQYVCSLANRAFGPQPIWGNILSFISSLAIGIFLFLIVVHRTGDRAAGGIAALFFFASYKVCGFWYDLYRVDCFFLALALAGFYYLDKGNITLSIVLLSASVWTKQTGVFFILLGLLKLLYHRRIGDLLRFGAGIILVNGLLFFTLDRGWLWFYLFKLPSRHPVFISRFLGGLKYLIASQPILILLGLFSLKHTTSIWQAGFLLFFPISLYTYSVHGANHNALLVFQIFLMVSMGMGWAAAKKEQFAKYLSLALIIQAGFFLYNPHSLFNPQESIRQSEARRRVVSYLSSIPGEVYVPESGYLVYLAGKTVYDDGTAIFDFNLAGYDTPQRFLEMFRRRRFKRIICHNYYMRELRFSFFYPYFFLQREHSRPMFEIHDLILKNYRRLPLRFDDWTVFAPRDDPIFTSSQAASGSV